MKSKLRIHTFIIKNIGWAGIQKSYCDGNIAVIKVSLVQEGISVSTYPDASLGPPDSETLTKDLNTIYNCNGVSIFRDCLDKALNYWINCFQDNLGVTVQFDVFDENFKRGKEIAPLSGNAEILELDKDDYKINLVKVEESGNKVAKFSMEYLNILSFMLIDGGIIILSKEYGGKSVRLTKIANYKIVAQLEVKTEYLNFSELSL